MIFYVDGFLLFFLLFRERGVVTCFIASTILLCTLHFTQFVKLLHTEHFFQFFQNFYFFLKKMVFSQASTFLEILHLYSLPFQTSPLLHSNPSRKQSPELVTDHRSLHSDNRGRQEGWKERVTWQKCLRLFLLFSSPPSVTLREGAGWPSQLT